MTVSLDCVLVDLTRRTKIGPNPHFTSAVKLSVGDLYLFGKQDVTMEKSSWSQTQIINFVHLIQLELILKVVYKPQLLHPIKPIAFKCCQPN